MSLENPFTQNKSQENASHTLLTSEEQKRFLVEPAHNKQLSNDDTKKAVLLKKLEEPLHRETIPQFEKKDPEITMLKIHTTRTRVGRTATNVVDFIPIIGSAKMIIEAIRGEQFGTEKEISGKVRLIHGISGVGFLVADLTGIGAIASEFGKAGIKILEKEVLVKIVENAIIKEEAVKLAVKGEQRIAKKEKLTEATT
jgi:hypothetical protein